ncbi:unnamed protein product [Owenia fusiformis]|uniref:THD domain-containing protein n=1 Tax=Owenia fusiformis TaxID=6347 RepID=A0A8J1Y239_OWEFU|nr:unnamed protein product [Owenia fusiformis]
MDTTSSKEDLLPKMKLSPDDLDVIQKQIHVLWTGIRLLLVYCIILTFVVAGCIVVIYTNTLRCDTTSGHLFLSQSQSNIQNDVPPLNEESSHIKVDKPQNNASSQAIRPGLRNVHSSIHQLRVRREVEDGSTVAPTKKPRVKKKRDKCKRYNKCLKKELVKELSKRVPAEVKKQIDTLPKPAATVLPAGTQDKNQKHNVIIHLEANEEPYMDKMEEGELSPKYTIHGTSCKYSLATGLACIDGLYKLWKFADWVTDEAKDRVSYKDGLLKVKDEGFYLIYAQVTFKTTMAENTMGVFLGVDGETNILECTTGVDTEPNKDKNAVPNTKEKASTRDRSCYISSPRHIKAGQILSIRDSRRIYSSITNRPTTDFWGIIKLN